MALIDQALLDSVERIAREAGEAIMAVYSRDFSVEEKADKSPLTEADKAAHDVIVAGLNALPQGIPVLSEEDEASFLDPDTDGRYWLVDPLDGTKEFIKRNDEFTVNIALIEYGQPVLGVVVAPALGPPISRQKGSEPLKSSEMASAMRFGWPVSRRRERPGVS